MLYAVPATMLSAIAPQVDTGGRYFFSRKKKSKRTETKLAFPNDSMTLVDLPMTRTTAGTPWIDTSIQVGILSNCGASDEEVGGPLLSGEKLAISGTMSPGARRIKPHCSDGSMHGPYRMKGTHVDC